MLQELGCLKAQEPCQNAQLLAETQEEGHCTLAVAVAGEVFAAAVVVPLSWKSWLHLQ